MLWLDLRVLHSRNHILRSSTCVKLHAYVVGRHLLGQGLALQRASTRGLTSMCRQLHSIKFEVLSYRTTTLLARATRISQAGQQNSAKHMIMLTHADDCNLVALTIVYSSLVRQLNKVSQ